MRHTPAALPTGDARGDLLTRCGTPYCDPVESVECEGCIKNDGESCWAVIDFTDWFRHTRSFVESRRCKSISRLKFASNVAPPSTYLSTMPYTSHATCFHFAEHVQYYTDLFSVFLREMPIRLLVKMFQAEKTNARRWVSPTMPSNEPLT